MASKLVKRTAVVQRRKGPSPALIKAQRALQSARKAARKPPKTDLIGPAMCAAAGAAFAYVDARKPSLSMVKGLPLPLIYGVAGVALGTMVRATAKGTVGQVLRETGSAGLTLGVYKLVASKVGGEATEGDFEEATEGDFEED